jgi:hypothetical protein
MAAFGDAALANFENQMVKQLQSFTPKHCEVIGDGGVRNVIRLGIERAEIHHLTNRGPVRFYIELMFMLGSDFDSDPQLPWVARILDDPNTPDEMARARSLYDKTMEYLDQVAGPEYRYAKEALRRAKQLKPEDLAIARQGFEANLLGHLNRFYPQKFKFVGEAALRSLVPRAMELAKEYSMASNSGLVLLIGLAFTLGHGFAADPQFPWIESTLKNDQIADPDKRVERLYSKSMTYLGKVLAYHER